MQLRSNYLNPWYQTPIHVVRLILYGHRRAPDGSRYYYVYARGLPHDGWIERDGLYLYHRFYVKAESLRSHWYTATVTVTGKYLLAYRMYRM